MSVVSVPARPLRRSPIDGGHGVAADLSFVREDMARPLPLDRTVVSDAAVVLKEMSWRRRFGLKGPAAESWLATHHFHVPSKANSWVVADGILVARLATSEFLVEALEAGQARVAVAARELYAHDRPLAVYPVPRQDLVVELQGPALNDLLRQTCSVDFAPPRGLRASDAGPLVLTSMIGVAVIAIPRELSGRRELTLWVDPSYAHYFWTTLLAVAVDLGGGVLLDQPHGAYGDHT